MAFAAGVAEARATLDLGGKSSKCVQFGGARFRADHARTGSLVDSGFQHAVNFAELHQLGSHFAQPHSQFVQLALRVPPENLLLFSVLAPFLSDSGGQVLDAIQAFFRRHSAISLCRLSHLPVGDESGSLRPGDFA